MSILLLTIATTTAKVEVSTMEPTMAMAVVVELIPRRPKCFGISTDTIFRALRIDSFLSCQKQRKDSKIKLT